jgi:hypothetical protein
LGEEPESAHVQPPVVPEVCAVILFVAKKTENEE